MGKVSVEPNMLFRPGPFPHMNACVGDNGGPYDYADYGKGFFEAGHEIVAAIRACRVPADTAIYPAAFSYRHAIELYLKALGVALARANGLNAPLAKHHSLAQHWKNVAEAMGQAGIERFGALEVSIAGDIIADFEQVDPTGQVFRYPEDLKGNLHLTALKIINADILGEGMGMLQEMLEGWHRSVDGKS